MARGPGLSRLCPILMRDLEEFLCLLGGDTGHQDQTLLLCLDGITGTVHSNLQYSWVWPSWLPSAQGSSE